MNIYRRIAFIILFSISVLIVHAQSPKREFRGVWIATVNHIDWPSKPGAEPILQQAELLIMLDNLEKMHFNAVIFQVRPTADAFYKSATEPWSAYLTGKQGTAPKPDWDPLEFMATECHKRGMELHAWFNPFRISQNPKDELSPKNVAIRHPDWVVEYGGKKYLDPGLPAVRNYMNSVVAEVVRKYDVDAIHFDDYFYPYPVANTPFPDTLSYRKYANNVMPNNLENWRRNNVDLIIESLNKTIKKLKPRVKFGISPFGVWRNYENDATGSVTKAGATNYDNLYADVVKWQKLGWIDYLIPQIYWEIGHPTADFITLTNWWGERAFGHHMYVGHALYKATESTADAWKNPEQIPEQVMITRRSKNMEGSAFFRYRYLDMNQNGTTDRLVAKEYNERALLPTMPWLDAIAPNNPSKLKAKGLFRKNLVVWKYKKKEQQSDDHLGYLIYYSSKPTELDTKTMDSVITFTTEQSLNLRDYNFPKSTTIYLWVTTIDKQHNESKPLGPIKIKTK